MTLLIAMLVVVAIAGLIGAMVGKYYERRAWNALMDEIKVFEKESQPQYWRWN